MAATAAAQERAMRFQEVILHATRGKMSWWQAAEVLGISPRTLRRWRVGYQKYGVRGLQDKRRVDRAPNGVPEAEIQRWLMLYEQRYGGYNVRHFCRVEAIAGRLSMVVHGGPSRPAAGRPREEEASAGPGTSCGGNRGPVVAS